MKNVLRGLLLGSSFYTAGILCEVIDLERYAQDFIVETKRITIPGYPFILNPSIVRWQNKLLMSFRIRQESTTNTIGLIWLDSQLRPQGKPFIVKMRYKEDLPIYATSQSGIKEQDPRLIVVNDKLYMAFNHAEVRKMFVAPLIFEDGTFIADNPTPLLYFEGAQPGLREKNWVPFEYNKRLLFAYSLAPHKILAPELNKKSCVTMAKTVTRHQWDWGELRGGTPALKIDGSYLAFFHSSQKIATVQSQGVNATHYFMGAYRFSAQPPFALTHISPTPLVADSFYGKHPYTLYKPLQVVFPCGFVADEKYVWVFYGHHDNEVWYAKLDKKRLYNSMVPVSA